ncbi:MAG: peptide chain release factor 1 [Bacteroidetes bacterium]|nr:MAG: peptide chain release factor 1 [Bacteroidota bacterium]
MLDQLEHIERRFKDVEQDIMDPEIMADMQRYKTLNKEYKELQKIVEKTRIYKEVLSNIANSRELVNAEDPEMREMAREELDSLEVQREQLEEELKMLLIPKDPDDSKNVVMEIRSGTGGDEAAIFAGDLFRMYQKYCDRKNFKLEVNSFTEGTSGGYKEIVATVSGEDAYGTLKYESGVHRVQRVPATESQGRIHTSAATVAMMPEADDFEIEINPADIKDETFCASGPGGQSVNTTYSAVRLTHIPTGIVVSMQDQKSQIKNREKAMKILRTRLYDLEMSKRKSKEDALRRSMVSTGDRSAKIRTYNFPQGRVTDHRIGLTIYNLSGIMDGDLDQLIEQLRIAENAERLKAGSDTPS